VVVSSPTTAPARTITATGVVEAKFYDWASNCNFYMKN
jgi:hypothetical protein